MIEIKDITEVQPMNDPNKDPIIRWKKLMTPEQKKEAVKRHNEVAAHCPNQMETVQNWEQLLPHQKEDYIKQARALLDGDN